MRVNWQFGALLFAVGTMMALPVRAEDKPKAFSDCTQQEVKSATLSIQSYACPNAHLVADEKSKGFALMSKDGKSETRKLVVRTFNKPASAPMAAILKAVRNASPGPHSKTCTLQPSRDSKSTVDKAQYVFAPTGAVAKKWDAAQVNGGKAKPPCGALGVQYEGDRIFKVMADDPAKVVFLDLGSEIQIFDPGTLKTIKAH